MKLIVSDFDLTFFDKDYENNIKLINEFTQNDNKFIIATGRFYHLLEKDIKNKNINFDYLICTSGAIIIDKNLNIISKTSIETNIILEIQDILKKQNFINKIYLDEIDNEIYGVYAVYTDLNKAELLLKEIISKYNINGYMSTHGLNFIAKGIDKSFSIEYLQKKLNIESKDIYVIGDNNNDIQMIKKYNGYVVGNKIKEGIKVNSFKEFIEKIK